MKKSFGTVCKAAIAGAALVATATAPVVAREQPFKQTNIHFETNATACDMGIQISFDTDGVTRGAIEDPNEKVVFSFQAVDGMAVTQDITEMFQERVEPPIVDLQSALGCEPSDDAISLTELLATWPAGRYEFEGESDGVEFEGAARLTHKVPAGPEITSPADGAIVPHDAPLLVTWKKVTRPILPRLGPIEVVGYHVLAVDITSPNLAPGKTKTSFNADVSKNETSFVVPKQYLEPGRIYELEILATEKGGNQTITEGGVFCTPPITPAKCTKP
jgi:hypothetical protein